MRVLQLASTVVVFTLWACDPSSSRTTLPTAPPSVKAKPASKPAVTQPTAAEAHEDRPAKIAPLKQPPQAPADKPRDDKKAQLSRYLLDSLNDIGPAAPASAFAHGVVMITRADELLISKLLAPASRSKKPTESALEPTSRGTQDFWPLARGPALSATHAYWISKGRLVRRALAGGELEVLANDARNGTRVAVAGSPEVVAYITQPVGKQDSRARLRLSDGKQLDLTPDGAAASSVSLASIGQDVIASFIDGRSGMTPVHARRFHTQSGTLDPDVVVWVCGATQGTTELVSIGTDHGSWLMLPVERDASHFGLATLALDKDPKMDPPLRWRTYENGLDRSPTAAATLCGVPTVAYVRPVDASPAANQELVLSDLTLNETESAEALATARGFADVSLFPLARGALLAYVADRRTWARLIRCK